MDKCHRAQTDGAPTASLRGDIDSEFTASVTTDSSATETARKNELALGCKTADSKNESEDEHRKNIRSSSFDRSPSLDGLSDKITTNLHDSSLRLRSFIAQPLPNHSGANEKDRQAILASQRKDEKIFNRNRRMFGLIRDTLEQFKTEERTRGESLSNLKRARIEEKQGLNDPESLSQAIEKQTTEGAISKVLVPTCGERFLIDYKEDLQKRFNNWERSHKHLGKYIQTETKPKIFWLPKEHNKETERRLRGTKDYFSLCLAERAAKLKKNLDELESDGASKSCPSESQTKS